MTIKELKRRLPITSVLRYFGVNPHLSKDWVSIKCPFHLDQVASASYSGVEGKFFCHAGCTDGDTWDIIDLGKMGAKTENVSEVIKWLELRFLGQKQIPNTAEPC